MHKLVIQCPDRPEQGAIFNIGMRCIIYWYVRICRVCVCARVDSLIKFAQSKHLLLADNKLLWRRDPSTQSCHDKNTLPITIGVPVPPSCIAPQDSLPIKLVIGETGNSLDRAAKVIFKRNGKKKRQRLVAQRTRCEMQVGTLMRNDSRSRGCPVRAEALEAPKWYRRHEVRAGKS